MADETAIANGVPSLDREERTVDVLYDLDQGEKESKLKQKIEGLEQEKLSLVKENKEAEDQMSILTSVIEYLKSQEGEMRHRLSSMEMEVESSEEIKGVLEMISRRASELETQVSRLQHDLISAMSDGQEASAEALELKKALGEKDGKLEELKKEKGEMDKKLRELERIVGVLEVKETEEKSKRVRIEEEMREKVGEKDKEIGEQKKRIEELEGNVRITEGKMAQSVIVELKDKSMEVTNGIEIDSEEKVGFKREQWPLAVVGSAGAAVVVLGATVLVYMYCAKRK